LGVHEYGNAMLTYVKSWIGLEPLVRELVVADREGRPHDVDGKAVNLGGFVAAYRADVIRVLHVIDLIQKEEFRLGVLQGQAKAHAEVVAKREAHVQKVMGELLAARAETAKQLEQLRRLQKELLAAQLRLTDAIHANQRLERQIRQAQGLLPKGAQ